MTTAARKALAQPEPYDPGSWLAGFHMAAQRTIGGVRRLRGLTMPGDPQEARIRRIAAEVEHCRLALARGDRVDAMVHHLRRALAVAEREWPEDEIPPATEGTSRWWAERDRCRT